MTSTKDGFSVASLPVVAAITARTRSEEQIQKALSALVGPTRSEPGYVSRELFVSAAGDHLAQAPAIFPLSPVRGS